MNFKKALLVAGLQLGWGAAHAAITCSFGASPGFTIANYLEGAASSQASSVTVNCTRSANGDPSSVTYTVAFDAGSNTNRASAVVGATTYYIGYTKAATTGCTPAITSVSGILSWPTTGPGKTGTLSSVANYAGCVSAQSGMAAATYTDSIGLTVTHNAGAGTASGSAPVSITLGSKCTAVVPGPLTFNYTAFRGTALVVPLGFGTTCTNTTPYTMAFDVSTGVVAGLAYSLSLDFPGGTGTGSQQPYVITGTMAAGQAGDCTSGCTGISNSHNVIVSY